MQVGDLVRIKYDGKVSIVTEVETVQFGSDEHINTWIHLHNERLVFKAEKLEVISASR
jgi:hypothetical protein